MSQEIDLIPLNSCVKTQGAVKRLLSSGETVVCIHRQSGKTRRVAFKALYQNSKDFWLNPHSSWEYFLHRTVAEHLQLPIEEGGPRVGIPSEILDLQEEIIEEIDEGLSKTEEGVGSINFGPEYERIEKLPLSQRIDLLTEFKKRLDELAQKKAPLTEEKAEALVTSSRDAALINRATLWEALKLGDEEARQFTQGVVTATREMVKSTARLVDAEIFQHELIKRLIERSNGTVVQHMTRVFLNGLSFLSYYNEQIRSTSLTNRVRIQFAKRYRPYYRQLLPHLHPEDVVLERVFYKGMQAVPEVDFHHFATGFLVHDIGKADAIEYHEGEAGYNRDIIVEHVKIGYQAIMNKTNYPRQAGLIAGYHHEYYGDPSGYGYFREYLSQYRKANPKATQDYCMTYELEPILDYQALAYFPAKVLEIVDIYDSLTDPMRSYRQALEPQEAVRLMRKEFIEEKLKIDPILFELFVQFLERRFPN
ncbi:MAG: metal-dependent phosphohydrolase [Spirochaetes bacterium]|nr:metal-dependent phosphohydrolase [Spirochaetota bacterium]